MRILSGLAYPFLSKSHKVEQKYQDVRLPYLRAGMLYKLRYLLERKEKKRFIWLLVIVVAIGLFDVIGMASILPFMALVAKPDAVSSHPVLENIFDTLGLNTNREMLIATGCTMLALLTISNLLAIYSIWTQNKITQETTYQLSSRLLSHYYKKPYSFYLKHNISSLHSRLLEEVLNVTGGFLYPLIELISGVVVAIFIFALLIYLQPIVALLSALVLGGAYGFVFWFFKGPLKKMGQVSIQLGKERFTSLREGLAGIKSIKLHQAETFFHERFRVASEEFALLKPRYQMIALSPKYVIELIGIGGILLFTISLISWNDDVSQTLPLLSLYAFAGYRLIPALQKIFVAASRMKHTSASVDLLYNDLTVEEEQVETLDEEIALLTSKICLKQVNFSYQNSKDQISVLENINLCVHAGETVALVGRTGSGKTTIVDLMCGLIHTSKGSITVDGQVITKNNVISWRQQVGYVPQEVFLFDGTIKANVALGISDDEIDVNRLREACQMASIATFIEKELPRQYDTIIGDRGIRLSGGQRQRLGLARVLYKGASILVLDEATSALDNITEKKVIEAINEIGENLTTILIAHRLSTVRHADRIYLLEKGRVLASGTYDELMESSAEFREMAVTN